MEKWCKALLVSILLTGCVAKQQVEQSKHERLYQQLDNQEQTNLSEVQLLRLLNEFTVLDETQGIWQSSLLLSQFYLHQQRHNQQIDIELKEQAHRYASLALKAATQLGDGESRYQSTLQLFLVSGDKSYLQDARTVAQTDFQLNQLNYLLGDITSIVRLPNSAPHLEQAYVEYWLAKREQDPLLAQRAYQLFKEAENVAGIGDSLFLMAQLQCANQQKNTAADLAERAWHVFMADGDLKSAFNINQWTAEHECHW
jgi:hypothetical protein